MPPRPPPCLLYCALNTAVMLDFFFGRCSAFSVFAPSAGLFCSFACGFCAGLFSGAAVLFSAGLLSDTFSLFCAFAVFSAAADFPNFFLTISCAGSSILLEAAFTAYSVVFNVSIICLLSIPNSFARSYTLIFAIYLNSSHYSVVIAVSVSLRSSATVPRL